MINDSKEFDKIEKQFWKNSDKMDQLNPDDPEFDKLLEENDKLLEKLR